MLASEFLHAESMEVDDIDEEGCTGQHQIMEFFEMCAALITQLAR